MAELKITIGPLSASVTASNTKATTVMNNFLLITGYTGPNTNQAKLDFIVAHLQSYLTRRAKQHQISTTSGAAAQTALNDPANAFED